LHPHLLGCSGAVRSDRLWRHIDVVTMVTHHIFSAAAQTGAPIM